MGSMMAVRTHNNAISRYSARALIVAGSCFVMLLMSAATGLAHSLEGSGTDPSTDWGNAHLICVNCSVSQGNQVGVWQSVLFVDGYLARCGSTGIDGYFGSSTETGTENWQSKEGMAVDGMVGSQSWGRASNYLFNIEEPDSDGVVRTNVQYDGWYENVRFAAYRAQGSPFPYGWRRPGLITEVVHTSHPGINFADC